MAFTRTTTLKDSEIIQHAFPVEPAEYNYCVFPAALEDDQFVLFHATSARNAGKILKGGFMIPDPTGQAGLAS